MNLINGLKRGRHCDADNRDPRDVPHWLKPCSRKSESATTTINDLTNPLLEEIFVRLNAKSAHQGKCVSKRWLSLMSTPWFLRRFVRHKITFGGTSNSALPLHLPFALISRFYGQRYLGGIQNYCLMSSPNMFGSPDELFLRFLPCYGSVIRVVGTSNDLLLCRVEESPRIYYLCNPFTRHWVEIPLAPARENDVYDDSIIGFMCDPYYKVVDDHENGYHTVDTPYRYKIVRLSGFTSTFTESSSSSIILDIFSSETGEWSKLENSRCSRSLSAEHYRRCSGGFVSNGKLHWMYGSHYLFAYDPFNSNSDNNAVEVIDRPAKLMGCMNVHLGVCRGRLRLLKFSTSPNKKSIFKVWEIEDYETGKWRKVEGIRSFPENAISYASSRFHGTGRRRQQMMDHASTSFHPYDEDIVYLRVPSHVYSCNIRNGTFELLYKGNKAFGAKPMFCSLVQPWWPTPVSSLPSLI